MILSEYKRQKNASFNIAFSYLHLGRRIFSLSPVFFFFFHSLLSFSPYIKGKIYDRSRFDTPIFACIKRLYIQKIGHSKNRHHSKRNHKMVLSNSMFGWDGLRMDERASERDRASETRLWQELFLWFSPVFTTFLVFSSRRVGEV